MQGYVDAPGMYERFQSFTPSNPVSTSDPSFIAAGYDLSPIGWGSDGRGATLITPLHAVQSNHYSTGVGSTVTFQAGNGNVVQATVSASKKISGDLQLITFSAPVDASIQPAVISTRTASEVAGSNLLVFGKGGSVGTNTLDQISGNYALFGLGNVTGEAMPIVGDSGSPTFLTTGSGQMELLSIHSYVNDPDNPTQAYDTAITPFWSTLAAEVQGDGYSLALLEYTSRGSARRWL